MVIIIIFIIIIIITVILQLLSVYFLHDTITVEAEGAAASDLGKKILWNASLHVVGRQVRNAGLHPCEEGHLLSGAMKQDIRLAR